MVEAKYNERKGKAKASLLKASAVNLVSKMRIPYTVPNTDTYLAVTCHFIDDSSSLNAVVGGVLYVC